MDYPCWQPAILEVTERNFDAEVLQASQPTLVAFGTSWSKPCCVLKSVLGEMTAECTGRLGILRVDVDNNPDLGVLYGIESIPTLLLFVHGKVCARIVGTASREAILSKLESCYAQE